MGERDYLSSHYLSIFLRQQASATKRRSDSNFCNSCQLFFYGCGWPGLGFALVALAGGGALLDMGIHAIELAIWMLGPVKRVQAHSATLRKKIKVDDNAVVLLEFVGGRALAYVEVGWTSPSGFTGWEMCGDEGSMVFDYQGKLVLYRGYRDPSGAVTGLRSRVLDAKPMTWGWNTEIRDALRMLKAGQGGAFGTGPARHALAVALAAYESSRTGRRVTIRE